MPLDVIVPDRYDNGSGLLPVILLVVVVAGLLGFALWRYFSSRG